MMRKILVVGLIYVAICCTVHADQPSKMHVVYVVDFASTPLNRAVMDTLKDCCIKEVQIALTCPEGELCEVLTLTENPDGFRILSTIMGSDDQKKLLDSQKHEVLGNATIPDKPTEWKKEVKKDPPAKN